MSHLDLLTIVCAALSGAAAGLVAMRTAAAHRAVNHGAPELAVARWIAHGLALAVGGSRETRRVPFAMLLPAAFGALVTVPLLGVLPGLAVAGAMVPAAAAWRRRAVRRRATAVDRCARGLAQALSAALSAGNSVHGSLAVAAGGVDEPLRGYVERAARELALGYRIGDVLSRMADGTGSRRIEVLTGALLVQRRSGGDLVRLLGELAESFRRDDAVRAEAHGATAQARITAWIVIGAPAAVALIAELLHRGALTGVLAVPFALGVLALALAMHVAGGWLVLRIARVG